MNARRGWLAAGAALPALAWMGSLPAQAKPPVVVGWLSGGSLPRGSGLLKAFIEGMAELGWKRGAQYVLEERHADGDAQRLPALAQEIAAKRPAVIAAWPSAAAKAANEAAPTTLVVLVVGDPVVAGLVKSLARPEGMITGMSNMSSDMNLKVIELLMESLPKLQRVGFLADSTARGEDLNVNNVRRAAERFGFQAVIAGMAQPQDIEPAFVRLAKDKVQALVILPSSWFNAHESKMVQLALTHRWPVVSVRAGIPNAGGLFSYGPNGTALARRSAHYVDRILKGAKPGDLPIEQPTAFDFVLNLKTAKTLGITIPSAMRVRATEVIE